MSDAVPVAPGSNVLTGASSGLLGEGHGQAAPEPRRQGRARRSVLGAGRTENLKRIADEIQQHGGQFSKALPQASSPWFAFDNAAPPGVIRPLAG